MRSLNFISICYVLFCVNFYQTCNASSDRSHLPAWVDKENDDKTVIELNRVRQELDVYRLSTQILAPALVVKTGYHLLLNQEQQNSSTCMKAAVGLSAAMTLYLVGRSYLFTDDDKK